MHKRLLTYIFLLGIAITAKLSAQSISISDSFTDSNFTSNPQWFGDTSKFIVNSNYQLQLNDVQANSPAYLILPSPIISNVSWEFWIKMDFAPSPTNYARVYLTSTSPDLTGNTEGYYLKIGGITGNLDNVSLYRQSGNNSTLLIDGLDGTVGLAPAMAKVKVTKDSLGEWELFLDTTLAANQYVSQGKASDLTHLESKYFGVVCYYTATRSDKFFFDDFYLKGEAFRDTIKPKLLAIEVVDSTKLILSFTKNLDPLTARDTNNYIVNKAIDKPIAINFIQGDSSQLELSFTNAFKNGETYHLTVENIKDQSDNTLIKDSLPFLYFVPDTPFYKDVVINEFYPDESESNGLPEAEFVELYNASNKIFDLFNWQISDASTTQKLPSHLFRPKEYVIICSQKDSLAYAQYGTVVAVRSLPTLNNNGDLIRIEDSDSYIVDELTYDKSWYVDQEKSNGGWSIEKIDPYTHCDGKGNFAASKAIIGGTPGKANSHFNSSPDTIPPKLIKIEVLSFLEIELQFDKAIDTSLLPSSFIFSDGNSVKELRFVPEIYDSFILLMNRQLTRGKEIKLSIQNLKDCKGNLMPLTHRNILLGEQAIKGDIIINEILFNPYTGGKDFVEIYNRSDKIIDLKDWSIANGFNGNPEIIHPLPSSSKLLYPGEYLVLTEEVLAVERFYPKSVVQNFLELNKLPAYNNDKGEVYLFDEQDELIDYVSYTDKMHFELLRNVKGVSLERINPNGSSEDVENFHSAAETEGFATPGYQNSQYSLGTTFKGKVNISPETFSPNNDGYQDWLNINYQFPTGGYVANVQVFDRQGRLIRRLVNNELLGEKGTFKWDGLTDDRRKAAVGIYLIYFEAFNVAGKKEVFKKAAVLVD